MLTEIQIQVYEGLRCPYCESKTKRVWGEYIYGKNYNDKDIICCVNYPKCDAYVGTHKDGRTFGRVANKELRDARKEAHAIFDKIWRSKLRDRSCLYRDLSQHLKIKEDYCHMGWFGVENCKKVIKWANRKYDKLNKERSELAKRKNNL